MGKPTQIFTAAFLRLAGGLRQATAGRPTDKKLNLLGEDCAFTPFERSVDRKAHFNRAPAASIVKP